MSATPYTVRYGPMLGNELRFALFVDVINTIRLLHQAGIEFQVFNMDEYDYATDTGVSDGLTDDEREQVWEYR